MYGHWRTLIKNYWQYRKHFLAAWVFQISCVFSNACCVPWQYNTWLKLYFLKKKKKRKRKENLKKKYNLIQFLTVDSHCYQAGHKSPECPVCSHPLNILGRPLPYAHCAQSRLVCPMSGHIMNENNPPMVLPNGYVYGENVSIESRTNPFAFHSHL